jgi:phosphoribosylformylglycinamidine synthase subunit PurS
MKIKVLVRLKKGVLDVQGKAIEHGLADTTISSVRVGKLIELDVKAFSFEQAQQKVKELCDKILCNPVMETYEILQAE